MAKEGLVAFQLTVYTVNAVTVYIKLFDMYAIDFLEKLLADYNFLATKE